MSETTATISEDEYASAMGLHARPSPKLRAVYLLAASGLFFATSVGGGSVRLIAACALVAGGVGHFAMTRLLVPWRARRNYRRYALIRRPFLVEPKSTGVHFKSEIGETRLGWGDIHKWRVDAEFVLIYAAAPHLFHVVPKRLADGGLDIAFLTSSLEKNLGNAT